MYIVHVAVGTYYWNVGNRTYILKCKYDDKINT